MFPATKPYVRRSQRLYSGVPEIRQRNTRCRKSSFGERCPMRVFKETNGAPAVALNVQLQRNSGWPTGRESYGHGAPVVVGGRKGTAPPSTTGKPATGRRGSRRKSARAHGATPMGRAGVNENPAGRGT